LIFGLLGGDSIEYYAHSENQQDELHLLIDHLLGTAKLAGKFASKFNAKDIGYYTGLWHDLGKFSPEFQTYLLDQAATRGPDHSSAGAIFALKFLEILAFPIAGHHTGLVDLQDLKQRLKNKGKDARVNRSNEIAQAIVDRLTPSVTLSKCLPSQIISRNASLEFFIRMVFSCLVDADYSDTERHFDYNTSILRGTEDTISYLHELFTESYLKMTRAAEPSHLNSVRSEIYETCLLAAENKPGIFRLTVPTGGGKTLASMAFALHHAVLYNLDRVIVAIPYTSIIEQTASVYKDIFGSNRVLEHHSAISFDSEDSKSTIRLAADNWDARIIVTTTVQLFESIFSNRPAKCRKIHNLARSIIILDEVQTLPLHLLVPILDVIQELVDNYETTVVLCTATQPALGRGPFLKGLNGIRDIIPCSKKYFVDLQRVDYFIPACTEKWSWDRVADEMRQYHQCMVVVNTKKDALSLLSAMGDRKVLHLSTLMCGAHRRRALDEVRRRLQGGLPCQLVSTQVVEAGVDLDFPVVMRAIGPLDRIVQAAGRCNREGKLADVEGNLVNGQVIIFEPEEGSLPRGAYRSATDEARIIISSAKSDLHDPDLYEKYFYKLYQDVETDAKDIQKLRDTKLNFEQIAQKFEMIDSPTVPALVNYIPDERTVNRIKDQLKFGQVSRELVQEMQPYLVNIYQDQVDRLMRDGLIQQLAEGLYEWTGIYDPVYGIAEGNYDAESLIG
jgi:CRISPR-associated endonuclease/helicase Cas3